MGNKMSIGLFLAASQNSDYHSTIEQARIADQLGFSSVWLTEKHFDQAYLLWSSPLITASFIAAQTQRIKIGFAACVSTLHHPVRLAEDFANLDVLSKGRIIIGLTRTSLSEYYHEVFQSPMKKAWKKFDEQFEIMQKLWLNKFQKHAGSFYKIPAVKLYPPLIQQPTPPIYFIAGGDESIIDAAQKGVGIFLHAFQGVAVINTKKRLYEDHFIDALGLGPRVVLSRFAYTGSDSQSTIADIQQPFMRFIEEHLPNVKNSLEKEFNRVPDFNFFREEFAVIGDGAECLKKIEFIKAETGIQDLVLLCNLPTLEHCYSLESIKRFALSVFPQYHDSAVPV
jgi:alkanesulfonate monooxygenase SsuD/methylene tetrahydromethanopterin reductase-like flavin-dependent oxidoreductase (luciferase family)